MSRIILPLLILIFGFQPAEAQVSKQILNGASIEPQVGQTLPMSATFRDASGHATAIRDVIGKRPVVLCLVYYECPMLCKLAADGLIRTVSSLPENVGKDFDVLFVSFDPRDTPELAAAARKHALKNYSRKGTDAGWHFWTGTKENIDELTEAVGFHYVWDPESKQFAHATGLMIVSPDGIITEYLDGVNYSPNDLSNSVARAANNDLTESGPVSFVRCYLYDPTTGKFGAAVQWTLRILGVGTVLGIVALIFRLSARKQEANEDPVKIET